MKKAAGIVYHLLVLLVTVTDSQVFPPPPKTAALGVEVGSRPPAFCDVMKESRPFTNPQGNNTPVDDHGWPMTDGQVVVFDLRPAFAWAPPIDDPEKKIPKYLNGIWKLSFVGISNVSIAQKSFAGSITNIKFDNTTNMTTADIQYPGKTDALMVLLFSNTQRTPSSPNNTGVTNISIIAPYCDQSNPTLFNPYFIKALEPFDHMRFMGVLGTNYQAGYYGDTGNHIFSWDQRSFPNDSIQAGWTSLRPGKHGWSWEYVILLANEVNKDIWINIPVSASGCLPYPDKNCEQDTSSYIYQLALLLKNGNSYTNNQGLKNNLRIYVEHSNEVWNFGFSQYIWNKLNAADRVKKDPKISIAFNTTDQEVMARRNHALRLIEIGNIFANVFGSSAYNRKIFLILAEWTNFPRHYNDILNWANMFYGSPGKYFYALAQTHYFSDSSAPENAKIDQILQAIKNSSESSYKNTLEIGEVASLWGLKLAAYEAGPGMKVGDKVNIGNRIEAQRNSDIKSIVVEDVLDNWFGLPRPGDIYNYFSLSGAYSRYGCWGATDDIADLNTPKYQAILQITATLSKRQT
jgi:hypothetical protein